MSWGPSAGWLASLKCVHLVGQLSQLQVFFLCLGACLQFQLPLCVWKSHSLPLAMLPLGFVIPESSVYLSVLSPMWLIFSEGPTPPQYFKYIWNLIRHIVKSSLYMVSPFLSVWSSVHKNKTEQNQTKHSAPFGKYYLVPFARTIWVLVRTQTG